MTKSEYLNKDSNSYKNGFNSRLEGFGVSMNPHESVCEERGLWIAGWVAANEALGGTEDGLEHAPESGESEFEGDVSPENDEGNDGFTIN